MVPVYDKFINDPRCILTDEDRADLRTRRGFTDATIARFKFKSCRPENSEIIESMRSEFTVEQLLESGLLVWRSSLAVPNSMVLQPPRILIPYLNENDQVFHLVPHRLGFKDVEIQPYVTNWAKEMVLTEGSFKAVASWQYGIPAIGIPGISSFSREHFQRLYNMLLAAGVSRVVIAFDREIKDDPALPNYKEDPEKRWDTNYYAALMARRIGRSSGEAGGITAAVASLPAEWMINGKIDIDGALAAGRTTEEYRAVINGAIGWRAYINSLPEDVQIMTLKRLKSFELSLVVRRNAKGLCYEVLRQPDDGSPAYWEEVSDFLMDFKNLVETPEGILREVIFEKAFSDPSNLCLIDAKNMIDPKKFQEMLFRYGHGTNRFFSKNPDDLAKVIDLEHSRTKATVILMPDHVGKLDNEDIWLFANGMIKDGNIYRPTPEGVCWNGTKAFKASRYINTRAAASSRWLDHTPAPDLDKYNEVDLPLMAQKLYENFGAENGGYEAVLGFCWALACPYSWALFEEFGSFPLLYLVGEPESGKSTFGGWVRRFFGIKSAGINMEEASNVGIGRYFSYYSSVPAFIDECRNYVLTKDRKESLLRSTYDRQPTVKGTRNAGEMRADVIRAPVMISGEELPSDVALNTRCLHIQFVRNRHGATTKWGCNYDWLCDQEDLMMPRILPYVLLNGPSLEEVIKETRECYKGIKQRTSGAARVSLNYSIPLTMYYLMVSRQDTGFFKWCMDRCKATYEAKAEERPWQHFIEDLHFLELDRKIVRGVHYEIRENKLVMAFRTVFEAWEMRQRQLFDRTPPRYNTMLSMLSKEKWVISQSKNARIGNKVLKCMSFDCTPGGVAPKSLQSFAFPTIKVDE